MSMILLLPQLRFFREQRRLDCDGTYFRQFPSAVRNVSEPSEMPFFSQVGNP